MISDVIRRDQSSKHFKQHSITLISPFEEWFTGYFSKVSTGKTLS